MRIFLLFCLLFICNCQYIDSQRIYYKTGTSVAAKFLKTGSPSPTTCFCKDNASPCSLTTNSQSNGQILVIFNITLNLNTKCNLTSDQGDVYSLAFIDELAFTLQTGLLGTFDVLDLYSVPTITNLSSYFRNPNIFLDNILSIPFNSGFNFTSTNKNSILPYLYQNNGYYEVTFQFNDIDTSLMVRPFYLYNNITYQSIFPNNTKTSFNTTFILKGNFISNIDLRINNTIKSYNYLDSNTIQFVHTFFTSGYYAVFINGIQRDLIYAFDLPTTLSFGYTNTIYSELGCSFIGTNNFITAGGSFVKFQSRMDVFINELSTNVVCSLSNNYYSCQCPPLFNKRPNLPTLLTYSISFNQRDYFPVAEKITYFLPAPFKIAPIITPSPKNVIVYLFQNIYNTQMMLYAKVNTTELNINSTCSSISTYVWNCTLNETILNNLCKCSPCRTGVLSNGQCCSNGNCLPFCSFCSISFSFKYFEFDFPASDSLIYYSVFNVSSMTPNSISSSRTILLNGNNFYLNNQNTYISLNQTDDPYYKVNLTNCNSPPSCRDDEIIYPGKILLNLLFLNSTSSSFNVTSLPFGYYKVFLTNNQSFTDEITSFRYYSNSRFYFNSIIGDSGLSQSSPTGSNMTLLGENFFPSNSILVSYQIFTITLNETCTFISRNQLSCKTPNVYSIGISLPQLFRTSIAMDGLEYVSTSLNITFVQSVSPIIIQITPSKGPINPDTDDYTVSIRGITIGVDKCIFQSPTSFIEYTTTPTLVLDDQVTCVVPTSSIRNNATETQGTWLVKIRNTKSQLTSPSYNFDFYNNPIINSISPSSGDAIGNVPIYLNGIGFSIPKIDRVIFKLEEIQSSQDCQVISDTSLLCFTPTHPETNQGKISISFNENQFFTYKNATFTVLGCPVGYSSNHYSLPCQICPSGSFKPAAGFFDCVTCPFGSFQSLPGNSSCNLCPKRSTSPQGSVSISNCDCDINYYRLNGTTSGTECRDCPKGGICKGGSNIPQPRPGYWYNYIDSPINDWAFELCNNQDFCTGNLSSNLGCIEGRKGRLCEDCWEGYYKSSGHCLVCNNDVRWRMILIIIVLIVLLLLFFKFAQLKVSHLSSFSIAISYYQIIAVFSAYNFKWPQELKDLLNVLKFMNLDLDLFVPECIAQITYGMKYGATLALPIIFAALLIVVFILELIRTLLTNIYGSFLKKNLKLLWTKNDNNYCTRLFSSWKRSFGDFIATPKSRRDLFEFMNQCIHTFVIIISFSYVFVVTKAAQIFNCVYISGIPYMDSDRSVICYQDNWWIFFTFSLLTLIVFGGGVTLLFGYILCCKKNFSPSFHSRFRFLFIRFREERLYWEMIIILRKLLISVSILFFSSYPIMVILFSMFIIFVSFLLQLHHSPFKRIWHNIMEYCVLLATEFLLFNALLFYIDDFQENWTKTFLSVLCILSVIVSTIFIIILMFIDFLLQFLNDRKQKNLQLEVEITPKFEQKRNQTTEIFYENE